MSGFFARLFAAILKAIDGISVIYVSTPGTPRLVATREEDFSMPPTFSYTIAAPAAFSDPTAAKFTLYASVAGTLVPPLAMQPGQSVEALSGVPLGATVDAYFTESDAAGNESGPGPHLTFTAVDDIAPAAPAGAPTIVSHVEVAAADPAVVPTPTPDPTPAQ